MIGQWPEQSRFKEVLEQVRRSAGTDCGPQIMRRSYSAMMLGNWVSFEGRKQEGRKAL